MAVLEIILMVVVFLIAAIPLHITVKLLGGDSSLIKAAIVNFLVGLASGVISFFLKSFAGVISFIALLFIYKTMFDIGWIRALLAWLLQGVIIVLLIVLLAAIGLMIF
jgi:hypothetical protein